MRFCPELERVTAPPPERLSVPPLTIRSVTLPAEFSATLPVLCKPPVIVKPVLLLTFSVPALAPVPVPLLIVRLLLLLTTVPDPVVRLLMVRPAGTFTVNPAPITTSSVVLGTVPVFQLVGV